MKNFKKLLLMTALIAIPMFAMAQDDDSGGGPGGGGGGGSVPIDGGIGVLAAAGVAYGVKKYRDMQKKQ